MTGDLGEACVIESRRVPEVELRSFLFTDLVGSSAHWDSDADAMTARHAAWFAELSVASFLAMSTRHIGAEDSLAPEYENGRAVHEWALDHGEADTALWVGGALGLAWFHRGNPVEALRRGQAALALDGGDPLPRYLCLCTTALAATWSADPISGWALALDALVLQQTAPEGPPGVVWIPLTMLAANGEWSDGPTFDEAVAALRRTTTSEWDRDNALLQEGVYRCRLGDFERAIELFDEARDRMPPGTRSRSTG